MHVIVQPDRLTGNDGASNTTSILGVVGYNVPAVRGDQSSEHTGKWSIARGNLLSLFAEDVDESLVHSVGESRVFL